MVADFQKGDYVIKEGETGNILYFVMKGFCSAYKNVEGKNYPAKVYEYKENDYFGELALLRDEPRAASIMADNDLKVAYIDRSSFKRMLGPLQDLLKRNLDKYNKYVK